MKLYKLMCITLLLLLQLSGMQLYAQTEFKKNVYHRTSAVIKKDFPKSGGYENKALVHEKLLFSIYELLCIGDYKGSLSRYDSIFAPGFSFLDSLNHYKDADDYFPVSAQKYILEQARSARVLIINENHDQPQHRLFTETLLSGLYEAGFHYMAVEGLESDSLGRDRHVTLNSGYYTTEPRFANMLRQAATLGYSCVSYEAVSGAEMKKRDYYQAVHIKEKVFDRDPEAKLIVYCGFEHNDEQVRPDSSSAMAGWLKTIMGFDPLTIDQVLLTESSSHDLENTSYAILHANESAVFINKHDSLPLLPFDRKTTCDIYVYHPRTSYKNKRPGWLLNDKSYVEFAMPAIPDQLVFPVLVIAYNSSEKPGLAIPADAFEMASRTDKKNLVLKRGDYKVVLRDSKQKEQSLMIHVK